MAGTTRGGGGHLGLTHMETSHRMFLHHPPGGPLCRFDDAELKALPEDSFPKVKAKERGPMLNSLEVIQQLDYKASEKKFVCAPPPPGPGALCPCGRACTVAREALALRCDAPRPTHVLRRRRTRSRTSISGIKVRAARAWAGGGAAADAADGGRTGGIEPGNKASAVLSTAAVVVGRRGASALGR